MDVVTERAAVEAAFERAAVVMDHARQRLDGELGIVEHDGHVVAISAHRLGLARVPALELPRLERIDVGGNGLAELPAVPASVRELYVYDNALERLPALPAGLHVLDANRNRLVELPALDGVAFVYAAQNRLVAAPPMRGCRYANLSGNRLDSLPDDRALEELRLEDCGLTTLALGELTSLVELHLRGNQLRALPPLPGRLRVLDLRGNQFDDLPDLTHLPLVKLDLRWNPLRHGPRWLDRLDGALVYT